MELFFSGILFNEAWRRGIFKLDAFLRTRRSS